VTCTAEDFLQEAERLSRSRQPTSALIRGAASRLYYGFWHAFRIGVALEVTGLLPTRHADFWNAARRAAYCIRDRSTREGVLEAAELGERLRKHRVDADYKLERRMSAIQLGQDLKDARNLFPQLQSLGRSAGWMHSKAGFPV
jgi:hypothetical protein